jgi:hypothetical protein
VLKIIVSYFQKLFQRFPILFCYATLELTIQKIALKAIRKKNIRFLETVASVATLVQTTVMTARSPEAIV